MIYTSARALLRAGELSSLLKQRIIGLRKDGPPCVILEVKADKRRAFVKRLKLSKDDLGPNLSGEFKTKAAQAFYVVWHEGNPPDHYTVYAHGPTPELVADILSALKLDKSHVAWSLFL